MGQKAKNSGKKASKVCDKAANGKSVKHNGKKGGRTYIQMQIDGVNIFDIGDLKYADCRNWARHGEAISFGLV
jgi:hypothetical protein